jgi:hypothetical protein
MLRSLRRTLRKLILIEQEIKEIMNAAQRILALVVRADAAQAAIRTKLNNSIPPANVVQIEQALAIVVENLERDGDIEPPDESSSSS